MPRRDVLFAFAVRFALFFVPLAFLWLLVSPFYTSLIFAGANHVFQWENAPTAFVASVDGSLYAYRWTASGPTPAFEFERYGLFFNVVLLVALLLAAPGLTWRRRIQRTALGMILLAVVHVFFVVLQVKARLVNLGLLALSPESAYGYNWGAAFFGVLGEGLFPLLIFGLLSGRAWVEALGLRLPARPLWVARNALCPCGSGKKHKHCCGRA
jgi:hypothetical protein